MGKMNKQTRRKRFSSCCHSSGSSSSEGAGAEFFNTPESINFEVELKGIPFLRLPFKNFCNCAKLAVDSLWTNANELRNRYVAQKRAYYSLTN